MVCLKSDYLKTVLCEELPFQLYHLLKGCINLSMKCDAKNTSGAKPSGMPISGCMSLCHPHPHNRGEELTLEPSPFTCLNCNIKNPAGEYVLSSKV